MEPRKPKLPVEAVQLYNEFIHGHISRRDFFEGARKFAVGGLAAGTIIDMLMPDYAAAQQVSKSDERLKTGYETVPSPMGNGSIKGYLARPVSAGNAKLPGVLIVLASRGSRPAGR